ncbi:amidohydrolase family protein [Rhodococcus hoagii]|nr:amidohydrolase family protein [Prescottella equi]
MSGIIDVHTHYVPKGWPDLTADAGPDARGFGSRARPRPSSCWGSKEFRRIQADAWDAETRLHDMDADGVRTQVVSPTPAFFNYGRTGAQAERIARIFNDLALDIVAPAQDRLIPFCQVPLQDADAACREVERCVANGHRGVEIGNHVGDRDLDSEGVVTFLQHCASLDVPVFVHPWDMDSSPRLNRWMAQWLTAMPAETHLSILALILGGVFDRIDDRLKIGFRPRRWVLRLLARPDGERLAPPQRRDRHVRDAAVAYLGRFYVDSVVFDDRALRLLVDTVGVDRVMVGSDYPYPLRERPVGEVVRKSEFLTRPRGI